MKHFIFLTQSKDTTIACDSPSDYTIFLYNYSGKLSCDILSPGATVDILGLYDGSNSETFKVNTIQHHLAPDTVSNLYIKGVFRDNSRFQYSGLIRIEKEGQGSHAYQKNQNIMASKQAFVSSEPFLEILANDVFCTHGSSTGKLQEDAILYAMSRGLTREQSTQLLYAGFKAEVLDILQKKVTPEDFNRVLSVIS